MYNFPPLLLVFSTNNAVLIPCSDLPRPWPSRYPYFAIILEATDPPRPILCPRGGDCARSGTSTGGSSISEGGGAMAAPIPPVGRRGFS